MSSVFGFGPSDDRGMGRSGTIGAVALRSSSPAASRLKRQIGENLALAREAVGASQADWVRQYHLNPAKISEWERGKYYPDPAFLVRLCDDYGFTMDWFYRRLKAGVSSARAADLRSVEAASRAT